MALPFRSIEIKGFRSISDVGLRLENISDLNFICGQNNSGKSNLLAFMLILFNHLAKEGTYNFQPTDYHQGGSHQLSFSLFPNIEFLRQKNMLSEAQDEFYVLWKDQPLPWFKYSIANGRANFDVESHIDSVINRLPPNEWNRLWMKSGRSGGSIRQHWIPTVLGFVHPLQFLGLEADLIPALRTMSDIRAEGIAIDAQKQRVMRGGRPYYGGMGTVEMLFQNQHPPIGKESLQRDFERVQQFLRYITGNESVKIEIPSDKGTLIANIDGKRLPISNLGTGIEELVIISTAATHFHGQVVCIGLPPVPKTPS